MQLPYLKSIPRNSQQYIISFLGINKMPVVQDGEMVEMQNLTSDYSPCLSPRGKREIINTLDNPSDITSFGDKLFYIDEDKFYYNGVQKGTVSPGKKSIAVINDYVVIFPDKKHYDSIEDKFESMENAYNAQTGQISFTDSEITTTGGDFTGFKVGDGIVISGCSTYQANNRAAIIKMIEPKKLTFYSNTFEEGENEPGLVVIKREVPDMDFIIEANNRLWGCNDKNEIFASKQGSHTNFNVFDALVTDSYATSVGTPGMFTGAINYNNNILFFKEDAIHKIFGHKPANFQVMTQNTEGVKMGCDRSLAIANNILFYVSRSGVMAYNGTLPEDISRKLGRGKIQEAISGSDTKKYYISAKILDKWYMYVYDALLNVWHMEDNTHVLRFNYYNGELIYLDNNNKQIVKVDGTSNEIIKWYAIMGEMNEYYADKKGSSKIKLRIELEANSYLGIWIRCDSGDWQLIKSLNSLIKKSIYVPIQPQRCDYFQVKIEGTGDCKIYSIVREFYEGSEV